MADLDDNDLDEALRALSHSTRRAMIRLTLEREVPATELAELLGVAAATASEHLKVLRKTGLVQLTADGTWRRYRAMPARLAAVLAAVAHEVSPATDPQRS